MDVANRVKELREKAGLSKGELGRRAGLSESYIGQIESTKKHPTVDTVFQICKGLNITIQEFFKPGYDMNTAPPDIAQFAIDPKNKPLIKTIQGMQAAGYSNDVISEWLEALKKTLIELGKKYGAQPGKAVWPGASPEQQKKLQEKIKDPSGLRRKIEAFRQKK